MGKKAGGKGGDRTTKKVSIERKMEAHGVKRKSPVSRKRCPPKGVSEKPISNGVLLPLPTYYDQSECHEEE